MWTKIRKPSGSWKGKQSLTFIGIYAVLNSSHYLNMGKRGTQENAAGKQTQTLCSSGFYTLGGIKVLFSSSPVWLLEVTRTRTCLTWGRSCIHTSTQKNSSSVRITGDQVLAPYTWSWAVFSFKDLDTSQSIQ